MRSSPSVLLVFSITVTLCIAFQGAMSFSLTGNIVLAFYSVKEPKYTYFADPTM
jgi:hypothetical protein